MANTTLEQPAMQGKAHIFGLATGASDGNFGRITFLTGNGSVLGGYVSPNLQTLKLRHQATVERIKNQVGNYTGLISSGEFLECEFEYIPEGATTEEAKSSATLPPALSGAEITGLPIFPCGSFTDALNTSGGSAQPWFYEGEGNENGACDTKWTGTITLRRYPFIPSAIALDTF